MESVVKDLGFGLRMLARNPGFTAVAILTMALGLGMNTALFSVVNGVMLKSLPYPETDRLVFLLETNAKFPAPGVVMSSLNYQDWKQQSRSFESMGARQPFTAAFTNAERPERLAGEKVTSEYFSTLGVTPILGRTFTKEEDQPGGPALIVLSQGLWQRRFGGDPNLVGQTIQINNQPTTVIGVMPNDYRPNLEFWAPIRLVYQNADRNFHNLQVVGRLAKGVTLEQARAELTTIAAGLARQYPDSNSGWGAGAYRLQDMIVFNIRPALRMLLATVGLVLLIACANVANLLLARAATREKEIAIRLALGASRGRLIRQVLTESILISAMGGAVGLLIAFVSTRALVSLNAQGIPRAAEIGVDGTVLGFALLISVLSGLVFGLIPALQSSNPNLNDSLKEGIKTSGGQARGNRLRSALVVTQVALAFILLVGAGLLIKSFSQLQQVNVGFNRDRLLTMQISLPPTQYPEPASILNFYKSALERLSALPGVVSTAAISQAPLAGGGPQFIFSVEGRPLPSPSEAPMASYRTLTADYFQTLGVQILKGRGFTAHDDQTALQVAVVNQNLADTMWPGENPIGRRLTIGVPGPGEAPEWVTVVGVAGNVKHTTLTGETGMQIYHPVAQSPFLTEGLGRNLTFILRAASDVAGLIEPSRKAFAGLDPTLPVSNVKSMDAIISDSISPFRFNMFLLGLFALTAVLLTMIGVYGVMNYTVARRTREIGVRMALGAQAGQVRGLILKQGIILSSLGLGFGFIGCFGVLRLMTALLFGVSISDPLIFISVAVGVLLLSILACYIPAARATRVDPIIALRTQ